MIRQIYLDQAMKLNPELAKSFNPKWTTIPHIAMHDPKIAKPVAITVLDWGIREFIKHYGRKPTLAEIAGIHREGGRIGGVSEFSAPYRKTWQDQYDLLP